MPVESSPKPKGWHDALNDLILRGGDFQLNPSAKNFTALTRAMIVFQQIDKNHESPQTASALADGYMAQMDLDGKPLFGNIEIR